jgi:hypothetical protein
MLRLLAPRIAVFLLAAICAGSAAAALYKWTDAQGHVVYSDQPPPPGIASAQLKAPPPPADPTAAKTLAQREADFRKRQTDQAQATAKADQAQAAAATLAQNCARAASNLRQLADTGRAVVTYDKGGKSESPEVMSDAARKSEREQLTTWMRDNKCPS